MDEDVKREFARIDRRIDDVKADLKSVRSDVRAEVAAGFEGVERHISKVMPPGLDKKIESIETDVQRLADAEIAREKRKASEFEQEAERLAQEERRLAIEEKRLKNEGMRIQNQSGQHNALKLKAEAEDVPVESVHRRRMKVYALLVAALTAIAGGGYWTALSHLR